MKMRVLYFYRRSGQRRLTTESTKKGDPIVAIPTLTVLLFAVPSVLSVGPLKAIVEVMRSPEQDPAINKAGTITIIRDRNMQRDSL